MGKLNYKGYEVGDIIWVASSEEGYPADVFRRETFPKKRKVKKVHIEMSESDFGIHDDRSYITYGEYFKENRLDIKQLEKYVAKTKADCQKLCDIHNCELPEAVRHSQLQGG